MNKKNSLVNRILALLLAVVMIFSNSLTTEAARGTNTLVGVKNSGGASVNNFGQLVVIPILAVTDLKHSGFKREAEGINLLTINRESHFFGTKSSKDNNILNTVYFLPDIDDDAYYDEIFTDLKPSSADIRNYDISIAKKYLKTKKGDLLTGMNGSHWISYNQLDKECSDEYNALSDKGKKNYNKASLSTFFKKMKITMASYSLGNSSSTVSQIIDRATTDARKAFNKCAFFTVDTTANGYGKKDGWKHALYTEAWESKGEFDGFLPQLQQLIDEDADIKFTDISESNPLVCNLGFIIIFLPCDGSANLIKNDKYIWMSTFGYANESKVDEYKTAWSNLANGGLHSSYLVAKSVWGMTGKDTNSITSNFGTLKNKSRTGVYESYKTGFINKRKKDLTVRVGTKNDGSAKTAKRTVALVDSKYKSFSKNVKKLIKNNGSVYLFDCNDNNGDTDKDKWTDINSRGVYTAIVSSAKPIETPERAHLAADMVYAIDENHNTRLVQQDFIQFKAQDEDADENTLNYDQFDYETYDDTGMSTADVDQDDKVFDGDELDTNYQQSLVNQGYQKFKNTYIVGRVMPADTPLYSVGGNQAPWVFQYSVSPNVNTRPVQGGTLVTTPAMKSNKDATMSTTALNIGKSESLIGVTIESTNPGTRWGGYLYPDDATKSFKERPESGTENYLWLDPSATSTARMHIFTEASSSIVDLQHLAWLSNLRFTYGYGSGNNADGSKVRLGSSNGGLHYADTTDDAGNALAGAKIYNDGTTNGQAVPTSIEVWHKFGSVTSQLVTVPIETSFDSISGTYTGTVGNIEQKASATYLTSCCADFTLPSDTVAVVAIPNTYYTPSRENAIKSVRLDDMREEEMIGKIISEAESGVPATSKLSCKEGISGGEHFCTGEENADGYTVICITSPSHLDIKIKTSETDAEGVLYGQVVIRSYQLNKFTADIMNYCTGFDHALTTQSEVGTTYQWKDFYLQGKEYSDTADKEYTYNYKGKEKEFDDEKNKWIDKEVDKTATIKFTNVKKLDLGTYFEAKRTHYEDSFHTPSSTYLGDSATHKVENNGGRSVVNNIYGTEEITLNSAVTALSYTFNTKIWQTLSGVKPTSDAYYYNTGFAEEIPDTDGTMMTKYVGGNFVTAASFNSKASQMFSTWRKSDLNGTTFKASASSGTNHEDIGVLTYAVETRRKDFGDKKTISSISKQTTVKQSVKQSDGTYKDEDINVAVELSGLNAPHNTPQSPSKVNTKNKNILLADIKTSKIKWDSALQGYNIYKSNGDLDVAATNKRNLARSAAFCRREVTPSSATGSVKSYYLDGYITNSMYNEENLPKLLAYFNSRVNATKVLQDLYVGKTHEINGNVTNRYGELLSKYQEAKSKLNNSEIDYGTGLYKKTELNAKRYAEYFNHDVEFTPGSSTSNEDNRLWEFTLFNGLNAGAVEMYYAVLKNSDKSSLVTSDAALNKKNYPELSKDGSYSKFNVFNLDKDSPSIHRSIHFDGTQLDYKSVTFTYYERALKYSPSYKGVKAASDYKDGTNSYKDALVKNTLATSGKADGTLVFRDGVIGDTEIKKASPTAKLYDINNVAEYAAGKSDATATSANDYNWVALMYYPEVQMAYYSTLQKDKITSLDDVSRHITKVMADEQRKSYSSGLYIYSINTGLSDANSSQHTDDKYIVNPANTDDSVKGATISSGYQVTTQKDSNPVAYAGSDITLNVDSNFTINLYGYALDVTDKNNEGRADIEANASATPPVQAQSFGYTVSNKAVKKSDGLSTLANGYETEKTALEKYNDMEKHIADDSDIYGDWKNWSETVTEGENTITKRNTDRLLEQYKSWADSMLNPNNYETQLSLEVKKGATKSKEYDEFNVSFGKVAVVKDGKITNKAYNSKANNSEDGTYALNFENGELIRFRKDKTATGDTEEYYDSSYLALITQIADDSNLSLKEADEMFMNSNLYTAVLNAIQSSTNPASENGSGFDDLGKTDSDKHLGNKDNWYDEKVKSIVIRRFKTDSVTLSGIVCQDKLDYNITSAGSQDKYSGEWYFSTRLVNVDKTGIGTAGNLPATTNTKGEKILDIINHNHVVGADFDIRNSSQDAGN